MAKDIRIIHACNHLITNVEKKYGEIEMTRNKILAAPDTIPANHKIIRIDSVVNSKGVELRANVNYNQTISKNIIEWTDDIENPNPGESYKVTASYFKYSSVQYEQNKCVRCEGNRWFVSMVDTNNDFNEVQGAPKLIQYFLKTLYSNDSNRKTIYDLIGTTIYNPEIANNTVEGIINSCAEKMIKDQRKSLAKGVIFEDDELLEKIIITKIYYIKSASAYVVSLKLQSKAKLIVGFNFRL